MCCMTVSFLLSFLFGFADMTMVSLRAVCLILPVATSVFLLLAIRVDAGRSGSAGASHDAEMRGVSEQPARLEDRHTRKAAQHALPLGPSIAGYVIAGIAVGLIASACMRALWMYGAGGYNPSASVLPTYVESTFVAFTFVLMAFFSKGPSQGLFLSLIAPLAALIVGIVLCSFADIGMGFGLVATARTSFEFCLIASAVMFAHGVIARWSRLLGALFIIEGVTDLLTHFAIPRFLGVDVDTASGLISVISLTSMLIITLGLIVVAGVLIYRASTQAETVFRFEPSVDAISSAADALRIGVAEGALPQGERAEELLVLSFGLTRREAQIAACLARGNSAKKTAEILCLSAHTVQDYTKSIYSKMGIHSKQSLIDEVNELVGSSR